jgi:hypothetical protein
VCVCVVLMVIDMCLQVDIGRQRVFLPTYYTIRHGGSGRAHPNPPWDFQARVLDSDEWTTLRCVCVCVNLVSLLELFAV